MNFPQRKMFELLEDKYTTLLVCKTDHGKIYGAYSYKKYLDDEYTDDIYSFIFSVTDRKMFKNKNNGFKAARYNRFSGLLYGTELAIDPRPGMSYHRKHTVFEEYDPAVEEEGYQESFTITGIDVYVLE